MTPLSNRVGIPHVLTSIGMSFVLLVCVSGPGNAYPRPGKVERASVASDGTQGDGSSWQPAISGDGRYVVFGSHASNLAPRPPLSALAKWDYGLFLHDRKTGRNVRVDRSYDDGSATAKVKPLLSGNGTNYEPSISGTGAFIAYSSPESDLVAHDDNDLRDVFVYNRKMRRNELVSVASTGAQQKTSEDVNAQAAHPSISATGRYVAFNSYADNLVDGDHNRGGCTEPLLPSPISPLPLGLLSPPPCTKGNDVFVRDRKTDTTERVSVSSSGDEADGSSDLASISASGRYVVFESDAPNLVPNDTNTCRYVTSNQGAVTYNCLDVFVHDRKTHKTELVSKATNGTYGDRDSVLGWGPAISADGRYVMFTSTSENLVPNDTNSCLLPAVSLASPCPDVFVHDRKTDRTYRVSVSTDGEQLDDTMSYGASISGNGHEMNFLTTPTGVMSQANDAQSLVDYLLGSQGALAVDEPAITIHDYFTGASELVVPRYRGELGVTDSLGSEYDGPRYSGFDYSGRYMAFSNLNPRLVPDDTNKAVDIFVYDRGPAVGVGGQGDATEAAGGDDKLCVTADVCIPKPCVNGVCIPPNESVSTADPVADIDASLSEQGANLIGTSVTYRLQSRDLFVREELQSMPSVTGTPTLGNPEILYGLNFSVDGTSYQARVQRVASLDYDQAGGASFGLFKRDQATGLYTDKVATLRGGYGTTGEEVVFSLPLNKIGLENGGQLNDATAFTALESYQVGAVKTLDTVRFDG